MNGKVINHGVLLAVLLLALSEVTLSEDILINCDLPADRRRLNVQECHAAMDHTELDCNKEGFFINRFREHASWQRGSKTTRHVPASQSVCCRPEMPEIPELEEVLPKDVYPVGVLSIGCHVATNEGHHNMACEGSEGRGNSFVTGFVESFWAQARGDSRILVPARGVVCCTPVLLMSSGDAWELERCNCRESTSDEHTESDCDAGQLLLGFKDAEYLNHHAVPIPPARCCDVCLGRYLYDTSQCDHLKSCNRHGVCIMGSCECFPDWVGEDCGVRKEDYFAEPEFESSIWWLGGLGFIGAFFCLFATFWIIRRTEQENPRATSDRGLLGLITSYINDAGSAGSTDTESARSATDDEGHRHETQDEAREPKRSHTDNEAYRPLLQMSCCLCEERPVQVTLIPCGHSNLCRKCSRKLTTCPFCRKTIVRRQRLFLSV